MLTRRATIVIFLLSTILLTTGFHTHIRSAPGSAFRLPVMPGVTVIVMQGNNQGDHIAIYGSEYAFDFAVLGQSNFVITAAQGGQVIGVNDNSIIQCDQLNEESYPEQKPLDKCWAHANFVLIADDDGKTASLYVHLLAYSNGTTMPEVTCGEHVNQGDPIGLAGTTGYSFGVHVHFQVESLPASISTSYCQQLNPSSGWWWANSLPITFSNQEVLRQDADGVPITGQHFGVSNSPVVSSPPTATPIPTPTPPIPVLVPTPTLPPPPPTPQPVLTPGTWQGQATSDGGSPYPTQLVIDSVNGNTFTGVYGIAGPGNSAEPIQNGQINGNTITFTTPTQVPNEVATYTGTISGNTITGMWSYPGGGGTFTVTKEA